MKITCAKRSRDEIIRDRDAYDSKKRAIHEEYENQRRALRDAEEDIYNAVKAEIQDALSSFTALNLDIQISSSWRVDGNGLECRVSSNDHNVHDAHKALSWDWKANITEDGEVKKETGSWSGLQATTAEQLDSLKQTVACLEVLNSLDWPELLGVETPKYSDYITVNTYDVDRNRPDFEQELLESDIDGIIGKPAIVESVRGAGRNYNGVVYFSIVGETPKMYKVVEIPASHVAGVQDNQEVRPGVNTLASLIDYYEEHAYVFSITKDKFFDLIKQPVNILEG